MNTPPDYIAPEVAIPVILILWAAFWLVDTAPARRAKRRDRQLARLGR